MRLSGVMIGSQNPQALGEFYSKVLGEPGFRDGDWWGWSDGAQLMLGSHSEVKGRNDLPQRIMLTLEVEDVAAAYEAILGFGATSIAGPYQPEGGEGMWLATVSDPDGNFVQLAPPWT